MPQSSNSSYSCYDTLSCGLRFYPRCGWSKRTIGRSQLWTTGDKKKAIEFAEALLTGGALPESVGHFAGILSREDRVYAFVDHCRSIPIFYSINRDPALAAQPGHLLANSDSRALDPVGVLEAAMAGYVLGRDTIYQEIKQVEPGQILSWRGGTRHPTTRKYFLYKKKLTYEDDAATRSFLMNAIDSAIDRTIAFAGNDPVWVPLSGGLDSRLIIAKLKARGCSNLNCFSYGPRNNGDAVVAKEVANRLEVSWHFVETPNAAAQSFLHADQRREYWNYADGLSSTPNNQDILPLIQLLKSGTLDKNSIIVNGQTGDFISGGHIPPFLLNTPMNAQNLVNSIIDQHFSLWRTLLTTNNKTIIAKSISEFLGIDLNDKSQLHPDFAVALWELFEFEGRQAKYIINGQRCYEFLGLRWTLPLWEGDVVRFWRDTTHTLKLRQHLYREVLLTWDYAGVFSMRTRPVTAWNRYLSGLIVPLSVLTRLIAGRSRRDRWITYARYLDRFGHHYQAFGWKYFSRHAPSARNPLSYYTRLWLAELGVDWPEEYIRK